MSAQKSEPRTEMHSAVRFQQQLQLPPHIEWPEVDKQGKALTVSDENLHALICALGTELRFNRFTNETEIKVRGEFLQLADHHLDYIWALAHKRGFRIKHPDLLRMVRVLALHRSYHPILDYFSSIAWDGKPRVDTWLTTYIGAADTPINQAFGRSALLGAVRRILEPGCKHDLMLVLEGDQGTEKSSAIAVLGGQWYGDGLKLGLGAKETIEQTHGQWIVEIPELGGMQTREVEAVKHQISCQTDRARLAFGRVTSTVPRQCIFFASTNGDKYLKDQTGARRFCPVAVGCIDLEALRRDRDQLWAEAYVRASKGESAGIPRDLWQAAKEVQETRRTLSPIEEAVREKLDGISTGYIAKDDVRKALGFQTAKDMPQPAMNELTRVMKSLGWLSGDNAKRRPPWGGEAIRVYQKLDPGRCAGWLELHEGKFAPYVTPLAPSSSQTDF